MSAELGAEIRERMDNIWTDYFSDSGAGYEVLTGALPQNASVMIIGYNPGGGERGADEYHDRMQSLGYEAPDDAAGLRDSSEHTPSDFSLPDIGHYDPDNEEISYSGPIITRLQDRVFHENTHLLENAVETNRYYLRTSGKGEHKGWLEEMSPEAYDEYTSFCRDTTQTVIEETTPNTIVDFSGEYRALELCNDLGFDAEPTTREVSGVTSPTAVRIYVAEMSVPPHSTVVSLRPHLSAPISSEGLRFFEDEIAKYLPT